MPKLTHRATRKAFEFLRELYALRTHDQFSSHVIGAIPSLIPTDICSYNEMNSRRRHATYKMWPPDRTMIADAPEILGKYSHQHPLVTHVERTKDFTSRKITDFVTQREFRKTDLYNELYRPLRIPYNMGAALAVTPHSLLALGLNRDGRDFEDQDLAMLNVIRPHVVQAFGNAVAVTQMQDILATLHRALEEIDRAVLSVSPQGRIQWATPRAAHLLMNYGLQGKRRSDRLPSPLREWVTQQLATLDSRSDLPSPLAPLVLERDSGSLTIRLVRDGTQRLLFLEEHRTEFSPTSLNHLGLRRRETEILGWVAQGKTNPEIGTILGISPRTVQKHLERIYGRLGVENRHAAITIAMETMRQGRWGDRL